MRKPEHDYTHRTLLQKLGVKPEHRVYCKNVALGIPSVASLRGEFDLIFYKVDHPRDLNVIERLAAHLKAVGALWIFHPKGKGASSNEHEVRACGLAAGLVDNKVSAYTDTHTATRYVVPLAKR